MQELETILISVVRSNVRKILANEISSLKTKIDIFEAEEKDNTQQQQNSTTTEEKSPAKPNLYTTKITTYGKSLYKIVDIL